jgi:hypothetical protein
MPLSPGDRLGPYEIVSALSAGGWAIVGESSAIGWATLPLITRLGL